MKILFLSFYLFRLIRRHASPGTVSSESEPSPRRQGRRCVLPVSVCVCVCVCIVYHFWLPVDMSPCMQFPLYSVEYHLGSEKFPIWERCTHYREYPTSEIVGLLMGKDVPPEFVCSSVPTRAQSNMSFIVNMKSVKDPMDLRADDNGVWKHKGLRSLWVSVSGRKVDVPSSRSGALLRCSVSKRHTIPFSHLKISEGSS